MGNHITKYNSIKYTIDTFLAYFPSLFNLYEDNLDTWHILSRIVCIPAIVPLKVIMLGHNSTFLVKLGYELHIVQS